MLQVPADPEVAAAELVAPVEQVAPRADVGDSEGFEIPRGGGEEVGPAGEGGGVAGEVAADEGEEAGGGGDEGRGRGDLREGGWESMLGLRLCLGLWRGLLR